MEVCLVCVFKIQTYLISTLMIMAAMKYLMLRDSTNKTKQVRVTFKEIWNESLVIV